MACPNDEWNFIFLEEVEKCPTLWKPGTKGYKVKEASQAAWSEIAIKFGLDVATCRLKWKALRQKLRDKLKNNPHVSKEWKYYTRMEFLIKDKEDQLNATLQFLEERAKQQNPDNVSEMRSDVSDEEMDEEITIEDVPIVKIEPEPEPEPVNEETQNTIEPMEDNEMDVFDDDSDNGDNGVDSPNSDFCIDVLNAVRERPCLWNKDIPEYYNKDLIVKTWIELGIRFNLHDEVVKKKWNVLRERFRYRIKRFYNGEITFSELTQWVYYPAAEYLYHPIVKSSNLRMKTYIQEIFTEPPKRNTKYLKQKYKSNDVTDIDRHNLLKACSQDAIVIEEKKLTKFQANIEKNMDEDYMFLMSLLYTLKSVPHDVNLSLRLLIQSLVSEADAEME